MINIINERARFFDVCETISINIENIIVSISVFIVKRSDHKFVFKCFFQRAARMSFVNINDEFFEMMLHSLNEEKKVNFLNMFVEHINNKDKETIFVIKHLNV